jgi:uracil phosphoribosyltransferase
MITILNKSNTVFNQFLAEIRDKEIQKDGMRFRLNLERMAAIMAYEISKTLPFHSHQIQTPLGIAEESVPMEFPVITSILRAGLPLHHGLLSVFDKSPNGFISAYRNYEKDGTFHINLEYISCPDINNKILIIADPMLASGMSMKLAYDALMEKGIPRHTHIVVLIASKEGVNYIRKKLPEQKVSVWIGAVDDELTVKLYIVPGLGDAGDLAFGEKDIV